MRFLMAADGQALPLKLLHTEHDHENFRTWEKKIFWTLIVNYQLYAYENYCVIIINDKLTLLFTQVKLFLLALFFIYFFILF